MGQKAAVSIDMQSAGEASIHPYLFGHFVEDIRDHMDAMLAFVLKDMDFEDEAAGGVSSGWHPVTDGKNTLYALEPAAPRHSGHSQKIRVFGADRCRGGIGQRVSVEGGSTYNVRIVARAMPEVRSFVCELADSRSGELLARSEVALESHNWRTYRFSLTPSRDAEQAEFRLTISSEEEGWRDSTGSGTLWLDHVSMLPSYSRGIVKREIVEMTRRLKPGMMRLAGNHISAYHFEHAIGPDLERPNMVNEAWGGWTNKYFGTDEFIAFCRDTETEPLICVNAGTGTPEEAAAWLEYCNGSADTPYGAIRARNGHPEPFGVKHWEIGNEIYGPWQHGHCSAEEFAERYLRFAEAMKAVDSGIVLLACGDCDPAWNRAMLRQAAHRIDLLTLHIYHGFGTTGIHPGTPKEERYRHAAAFPEVTREMIRQTAELLDAEPAYAHVKLAVTEYNTMYYPNTIREGLPEEHTLEAAVANAANLNEFLRQSHRVKIGSFSDLVNGWLGGCIRVGDVYSDQYRGRLPGWSGKSRIIYGTPSYHVMELYANRSIARVVPARTECDTYFWKGSAPAIGLGARELPVLDAVACLDGSGEILTVFLVNRGLEPLETEVRIEGALPAPLPLAGGGSGIGGAQLAPLAGGRPGREGESPAPHADAAALREELKPLQAKLWEIAGEDFEAINSVFEPERITVRERVWPENGPIVLKPHSVCVAELRLAR